MNSTVDGCEGGCACGKVRYQLNTAPLIVHCCHCRYCQRQTGSAFAINALYETSQVKLLSGVVDKIVTPSPSGKGQTIARCAECHVALWSHYFMGGIDKLISFIRVGSLDNPDLLPPDVHIFTESKQSWVLLPPDTLVVQEFYNYATTWSAENQLIRKQLLEKSKSLAK
ncbi:GFA family protein [Marinicella litoralis]|uniref:CENP-V/GFA domain-containing protein n=1 Tax=Marinicella litoralis TaxID=644220 RepID=A0A4R6XTE0_9GAMM|nr:GFA family protein [Marinicella litoralis]TDR20703.1 hypothetical protein C8D91_1681 [Marinicella litoralis]